MNKTFRHDPVTRALAAYFRAGGTDQPSADSGVVEHDGKSYVVLRNVNGVLTVYRVLNDGGLKALKRWPTAVGEVLS